MKKLFIAALIASAATASFADSRIPAWNHANDSGKIENLTEARYHDVRSLRRDNDRIKLIATPTGVRTDNGIGYNDTHQRLFADSLN